ncbi:unnamed protein product [Parnassius apollo]|uniref:(apollo) hypothetical protein n=1 Tax=Parnassius apollo TaxID=110799 RepID=A0A8S3XIK8_PARAO|nr:unnamed protein product [Parnassius apollo]
MSGLWNNETCLTLIDAYESKRVLWDSTYEEYYNRIKKEDAWRDISDTLNISVDDVKKIVSLTGSFRRERSKQKRSSKTGSGQDQAYVSKWFAFDRMKFLMDKSEPNETRDSSNLSLFIFIIYTDYKEVMFACLELTNTTNSQTLPEITLVLLVQYG